MHMTMRCVWRFVVIAVASQHNVLRGSFFASAFSTLAPKRQLQRSQFSRRRQRMASPYTSNTHRRKLEPRHRHSDYGRHSSLSASPSGIDELPLIAQAGAFFGIYISLGLVTIPATMALEMISKSGVGLEKWRTSVIETTLPLLLGFLYLAAGIGHFANAQAFQDIYPPRGTWGLWYLPGSAEFHVAWTGLVEILGGSGLLLGAARIIFASDDEENDESLAMNLVIPFSALALIVLTVLVTPANIYMYTHGATMGGMEQLDLSFHYTRFAVQVAFLSLLITLARDSFFYAWGDELD